MWKKSDPEFKQETFITENKKNHLMNYINKRFFVEKTSVNKIAKKFGTPVYVYSLKKIEQNINNFKKVLNLLIL